MTQRRVVGFENTTDQGWRSTFTFFLILGLTGGVTLSSWAVPQFAFYKGEQCLGCHVNTFGGGLRTSRGFHEANRSGVIQPARMGIPFPDETRNTFLDNRLTLGADARFQSARSPQSSDSERRYFPMQAAVYSSYKISDWFFMEASYNFGPKKFFGQQKWTASAIIRPHGFSGQVRAGYFHPAIGIRYDDHTSLARRTAGADGSSLIPPNYAEYGAEFTYSLIPSLSLTAGLFKARSLAENRVIDHNGAEISLIRDRNHPSALARVELFHSPGRSITSIMGGGSVLVNGDFNLGNVFLGAGLFSNISVIAEYIRSDKSDFQHTDTGILDITYRWKNPMIFFIRGERGVVQFTRSSFKGDVYTNQGILGAQIFLFPHIELRPEYRLVDTDLYRATRYALQMHLFY